IATCVLDRTNDRATVPVFWKLICRCPKAEALRDADRDELMCFLQPLDLHYVRPARLKSMGFALWKDLPRPGVLYQTRGDKVGAWTSIGHLPGRG
ncbi:hypothetical protein K437DRAFT_227122, partial [Tilletiaria anomala UBC 951]